MFILDGGEIALTSLNEFYWLLFRQQLPSGVSLLSLNSNEGSDCSEFFKNTSSIPQKMKN